MKVFLKEADGYVATDLLPGDVLVIAPSPPRFWLRRPGGLRGAPLYVFSLNGGILRVVPLKIGSFEDPLLAIRTQYGDELSRVQWQLRVNYGHSVAFLLGRKRYVAKAKEEV
ncbi:MAG: hypothetical protein WAZ14_00575 [Patescibacteria group bacterium]